MPELRAKQRRHAVYTTLSYTNPCHMRAPRTLAPSLRVNGSTQSDASVIWCTKQLPRFFSPHATGDTLRLRHNSRDIMMSPRGVCTEEYSISFYS